jgi:hypothetical protein
VSPEGDVEIGKNLSVSGGDANYCVVPEAGSGIDPLKTAPVASGAGAQVVVADVGNTPPACPAGWEVNTFVYSESGQTPKFVRTGASFRIVVP